MENFFGVAPDFALRGGVGQRLLARIGFLPPALGFGIGSHLLHVAGEIGAGVFEIRKEIGFAVNLTLVN